MKRAFMIYAIISTVFLGLTAYGLAHAQPKHRVVLIGDDYTLDNGLPADKSFSHQLQGLLNQKGYPVKLTNFSQRGATTQSIVRQASAPLTISPHVVILSLGMNDAAHAFDPKKVKNNLDTLIQFYTNKGVKVVLIGAKAPAKYGIEYKKAFDDIYPTLASKYDLPFYPYLLSSVALRPEYLISGTPYPNADGVIKIVTYLQPIVARIWRNTNRKNISHFFNEG